MHRSVLNRLWLLPIVTGALTGTLAACDDDSSRPTALSATVDQSSFELPVNRVITSDEAGSKTVTPVASDGAFTLLLEAGHRYTFELDTELGPVPMVIDGARGQYARELAVKRGGARVDIGQIRLFDPAVTPASDNDVCVDGFFESSLEPCMEARATVECRRGKHDRGSHVDDHVSAELSTVTGPVAVPLLSLPATIQCKRGGHDDDDGGYDDDSSPDDDDGWRDDD